MLIPSNITVLSSCIARISVPFRRLEEELVRMAFVRIG